MLHLLSQQPERELDVQWGDSSSKAYLASVQILASDRQGLLRDISTIISNERVLIVGMDSQVDKKKQSSRMTINLEITNSDMLNRIMNKIALIDDVLDVKRLSQ